MFEPPQETRQSNGGRMWVATVVVIAMAGLGTWLYTTSKAPGGTSRATVSALPASNADPVHDLKVLSARMDKDRTGTVAQWTVDVDNKSKAYTYSNIEYETTYVGANNAALAVNKGTIAISLTPGDKQTAQIRDVLYPAGTTWYKFRILAAKARID